MAASYRFKIEQEQSISHTELLPFDCEQFIHFTL